MSPQAAVPGADTPFLTAEHHEFRLRARAALSSAVLPHADAWEQQGYISRDGWRTLGEQGLLSLPLGGDGFLHSAVLLEELGRTGYAGVRAAVGVHAYMAPSYLELFGSAEQRSTYLPAVRGGHGVAALAISEADAGSDLRHLSTRAVPLEAGGYRVSGEKLYVANGAQADFFVVLVRTRETPAGRGLTGASLLVVDGDAPGLTRARQPMLGWHSAGVCRISLDEVPVPQERLIGRADRALMYLMRALDFERLVAGLLAVGGVGHCLDLLNGFVRGHRVKEVPLSAHQAVRHRIADLVSEFEPLRQYAYHAAWLHREGRLDTRTASILKLRSTELAVAAAQACVQFHGARGYLSDSVVARLHRDAVAGTIAAGPSELLRDMVFETS